MSDDSMTALHQADPRNHPRIEDAAYDFEALRDRIVATGVGDPGPARPAARRRFRRAGFATGAVAAVSLAVVLAVAAPDLISRAGVGSAYAAAAEALERTAEVGSSGTIVTHLAVDPGSPVDERRLEPDLTFTFMWNGDDFDLSGLRRMRYVSGELYIWGEGGWDHYGLVAADTEPGGLHDWVASAKRAYAPERVGELVRRLDGLEKALQQDGSTVYAGSTTVQVVGETFSDGYYPATNNIVGMTLPDDTDPATPVEVRLTVGADGILTSWTGAYRTQGHDFVFTATYSGVGATPTIQAPESFSEGERTAK